MSQWEYKAITSGKGGFATPALLESYLNQLGSEEWEIVEFRSQPDNFLAFSGLARRLTQREWTLEAAAAAAARVEADKLRAEFAAKFQAASSPAAAAAGPAKEDSGNPTRDDSFRRPRDTDSDQDPYALDDSSEEAEEIPAEDQLPTFFEAVRPHMRRNQKGPGYSVGLEYLIKKFEMIEEDLMAALVEIGFAIPEDEDDKPVYIEYDGDIYWLNVNRRGEVWINTREKPRPVFKTVKATRITPEEQGSEGAESVEGQSQGQPDDRENRGRDGRESRESRRNERNEQRNRRNEQRNEQRNAQAAAPATVTPAEGSASGDVPAAVEGSAEGVASADGATAPADGSPAPAATPKPQREAGTPAPLPVGLDLLERIRPMMRRSRGGWSGTISYLSRALRRSDEELVAAFATIGLVAPATPGEKAPIVECGPFAYWLNKDGRGGIWINAREARRLRQEQKAHASADGATASESSEAGADVPAADSSAQAPSAEAPEGFIPGQTHPDDAATPTHAPAASPEAAVAAPAEPPAASDAVIAAAQQAIPLPAEQPDAVPVQDASASVESLVAQASASLPPSNEAGARSVEAIAASDEPVQRLSPPPSTLPLAGMRLLLKELRPGSFSGELCFLAEKLSKNAEECLGILLSTGLKAPDKPREKTVFVEHAGEVFWLNRNAKGELWLNAKASKYSRKDEESEESAEGETTEATTEGEAASDDKKPRRAPRTRKKATSEE